MRRFELVCRLLGVAVLLVSSAAISANLAGNANAAHHTRWVNVLAPFSGYWDKFGYSSPSSHPPGAIPGDWATDYYKEAGAQGKWYSVSSDGSGHIAKVGLRNNACGASSWTTAGLRYRIDMYWSSAPSTKFGHFAYVHVDPQVPGSQAESWLSVGATLSQGTTIGWTFKYSYLAGCWEVSNDSGTHWHILGYNQTHYSCWRPWTSGIPGGSWGDWLTQATSALGAVNSNATGTGQSCW